MISSQSARQPWHTCSKRARKILEDWDNYLPKFVKVMPVDYRRALQEMQIAQQAGVSTNMVAGGE